VIVSESNERSIERIRRAFKALSGMGISKDILVKTRKEIEKYHSVIASLELKILEEGRVLYEERKATEIEGLASKSES
jgi:hypothetical protein